MIMNYKMMAMQLTIRPNRQISDVQDEFNKMFPFLKLEFFRNRGPRNAEHSFEQMMRQNQKVGDGQSAITDGEMTIAPAMTVKELEKTFKNEFSLSVQVFRRSGNVWLETTMTDDWTLQHQNEHGRELSMVPKTDKEETDYDLERDADH